MVELSVKSLIKKAKQDPDISQFLPNVSENKVLNRKFLFDIINSVKPGFFTYNIRAIMAQKSEEHALKH